MSYNFSNTKTAIARIDEWLVKELSQVRTGRATPSILDSVKVDSYGALVPLMQVATITLEDARTLRVSPWDQAMGKVIEKAIVAGNLGLSVALDEKGVRVFFPELTTERRTVLLKLAKEKLESARATLRVERDKIGKDIEAVVKKGGIGEDEKFRLKADLQKMVDTANASLDSHFSKKEKEISS